MRLPDPRVLEDSVDANFLSWAPGSFDSSLDLRNNPSQIPSSFTCGAWPYGWSGFGQIGWFHGLTTLNDNVHATNSDATTIANASEALLGIDRETYLGVILQNAARRRARLPDGARPYAFLASVDPTPGEPGINSVIRMPGYPLGSPFIPGGLEANTPGYHVGEQLNGMSAFQHTLAPPTAPEPPHDVAARGAAVFERAGCAGCHAGAFFTDHSIHPQPEVGTQPARARALAALPRIVGPPRTYPPSAPVPLSPQTPVLDVPTDITDTAAMRLAYAQDGRGGYKVPGLIGLAVTAPYLHDGGAAASRDALARDAGGSYRVVRQDRMGLPGTVLEYVVPDPAASLRVLLDRELRSPAITANRMSGGLARSNADGSGHEFWVDSTAGFAPQDQEALVRYLLSLDYRSTATERAGVGRVTCETAR